MICSPNFLAGAGFSYRGRAPAKGKWILAKNNMHDLQLSQSDTTQVRLISVSILPTCHCSWVVTDQRRGVLFVRDLFITRPLPSYAPHFSFLSSSSFIKTRLHKNSPPLNRRRRRYCDMKNLWELLNDSEDGARCRVWIISHFTLGEYSCDLKIWKVTKKHKIHIMSYFCAKSYTGQ